MKKSAMLVAVMLFLGVSSARAVDYPDHTGYVNDFAGILSTETRASLESKVQGYEQQTSIEIAVVTVSSLGDESVEEYANTLFRKWGVGKKGLDNGLMFLVAPNEHKCRIEVGYGLEGSMTDLDAGRIIREVIIPYFKEKNYEGGIIAGTDAIVGHLGTKTLAERLEERRIQKAKEERRFRENVRSVIFFLLGLGVVIALLILVIYVSRWVQELKNRKSVRESVYKTIRNGMDAAEMEYAAFCNKVMVAKKILTLPRHQKVLEKMVKFVEKSFGDRKEFFGSVSIKAKQDPSGAERDLEGFQGYVDILRKQQELDQMVHDFKTVSDSVPAMLERAGIQVQDLKALLEDFRKEGYLKDFSEAVESIAIFVECARTAKDAGIFDPERCLEFLQKAKEVDDRVRRDVALLMQMKANTDRSVVLLRASLEQTVQRIPAAGKVLDVLAAKYSKTMWGLLKEAFDSVPRKLEEIQNMVQVAEQKNQLNERQDFKAAGETLSAAKSKLDKVVEILSAPAILQKKIEDAKAATPRLLESATYNRSQAQAGLRERLYDPAKSAFDAGQQKLTQAESLLDSGGLEILLIHEALTEAETLFAKSVRSSNDYKKKLEEEKQEAERKRRRKQEEEEEEQRRRASYAAASVSSISSSSSDSSSSSSFGGGDSGGGGASGSW